MLPPRPRLVIAGTGGDDGKTLLSLALLCGLRAQGLPVAAFKKGPDYIDRAWLAWAARHEARNLDLFFCDAATVRRSFWEAAARARVSVVEGNRGLHDGLDARGSGSTAELARVLEAPVVLIADCTKRTRTVAALVQGCQRLDPDCDVAGVILNRIAGARHERVVREAVTEITGLPVVGVIPRQPALGALLPDRHLGLVTPEEHGRGDELRQRLIELAGRLDRERLLALADGAPAFVQPEPVLPDDESSGRAEAVRIGVFRDQAFSFYYPENLEALARVGAELIPVSPMRDQRLPDLDCLYLGGGFPETQAEALARNPLCREVRQRSLSGLPIYAECGGLMYLAESFTWKGRTHRMAGVFPLRLAVEDRPQGHGYMQVGVDQENPFFARGEVLRGHEFHYSRIVSRNDAVTTAYRVERGSGLGDGRDGLVQGNTLASFLHLHALGVPGWAAGLVRAARRYRAERETKSGLDTGRVISNNSGKPS